MVQAQEKKPPVDPPPKPDDLSERLIRKALQDEDKDLMTDLVRLMGESARRIEIDFDPGPQTQAVQQRVQEKLEDAIKLAASRQRMRKQTPTPTDPDKRRMPTNPKRQPRSASKPQSAEPQEPGPPAAGTRTDVSAATDALPTDLKDVRRTWGNLPRRERDEVIQGVGEEFLERYRLWIERYYRALQERED